MAVVALIPTGRLEHRALGPALGRLFPDDRFVVRPPEAPLNGFTSRDVAPLVGAPPGPVPTELDELAAELVNAIFPGRRGERVDFAFAVEDLELVNDAQPHLVLHLFRDAVDRYIQATWRHNAVPRYAEVRERCSFHLLRPMVEAYFFGEPAALGRAGAVLPPQLPPNLDLEQFYMVDAPFWWLPQGTPRIANMPQRFRHPKSYLHYLCDPTLTNRRARYRETHEGVDALEEMDWEVVLSVVPHCPFLHALLDDLAQALNHPLSFVNQAHADMRTRFPGPHPRLLRNL